MKGTPQGAVSDRDSGSTRERRLDPSWIMAYSDLRSTCTPTLVSPLMTFEFELDSAASPLPPSPFSPLNEVRPGTGTSNGANGNGEARPSGDGKGGAGAGGARVGDEEAAGMGRLDARCGMSGPADDIDDFARVIELSLSRPSTSAGDMRPQTAGSNNGMPQFHSSLFPHKVVPESESATASPIMPAMSRSFIDSRDKPYGPSTTPRAPMMLANHSSPSLLRPESSGTGLRNPTQTSMKDEWPRTDYSGSTARPSTRASSGSPIVTIGTPYQATSSTFPLPQHVQTRPKNDETEAMVAGVKVPTHHTSASPKLASKAAAKPAESKRKTRLLNPLALLQRRRSEHPTDNADEERAQRQAQAQALARQKDVVASGVNKPPPDFDPRIKGKVVHDFSAPRGKRNTFDEMDLPLPPHGVHSSASSAFVSSNSPMSPSGFPPRTASLVNRGPRNYQTDKPERRSVHTPVFVEHLGENPEAERRISSIQAENLENKDFLQRASKQSAATSHSQESAVLPPFARRSQILDPLQASLVQDGDSKRSSDRSTTDKDPDTSFSSLGDISPITARSSALFGAASPNSSGKTSRPVSHITPPNEQTARLSPHLSKAPSQEKHRRTPSEVTTKSYSVILAPPAIETINEGSLDSSPVQLSAGTFASQEPHVVTQGISIQQSNGTSQAATGRSCFPAPQAHLDDTPETPTPVRTPDSQSPGSSRKLVEKRASAVGHGKRASTTPKKHASNASRFSFQLGESAAQEHALEEKHRKIVSSSGPAQPTPRALSPDEDEDDYFDEDAMDDMDEMELQSEQRDVDRPAVPPQSSLYLHQARQALQIPESDDGSMYGEDIPEVTDERDVPYADHPAFRAHPAMDHHFARNSALPGTSEDFSHDGYWRDSTLDSYMRDSYYSSQNSQHSRMQSKGSRTTVDTESALNQSSSVPSFQDYLSANEGGIGANRLSMPRSNLQVSATSSPAKKPRPPLPARDSGNSERNRVASGMAFSSNIPTPGSEKSQCVGDDMQSSDHHVRDMSFSTISEARSSITTNQEHLRGAETNSYKQPQPFTASAKTSRPAMLNLGTVAQSQDDNYIASPQLNKETLAGLERGCRTRENEPLASPKSSKSFRSDGRRNGSIGGLSLASPKSVFSHKSAGSDSFEVFAESSGLSRVGSPQIDRNVAGALSPSGDNAHQQQEAGRPGEHVDGAHVTTGLGLNMFSGFDFGQPMSCVANTSDDNKTTDVNANTFDPSKRQEQKTRFSLFPTQTNNGSRPDSRGLQKDAAPLHITMPQSNRTTTSHYSGLSDMSQSTAVPGDVANYSPVRSSMHPSFQPPRASEAFNDNKDDMYFDDGNFEQDISAPQQPAIDENVFDDDDFLARPGMNTSHRRDISSGAFSAASLGSAGPYPTFAMPNAAKARQRESQMMLEDLVLQEPVDPKLIPQRNPSEDARRLGTSDKGPPLPAEPSTSKEGFMHMQRSLDSYHAALANAANKAAVDGRFWRAPSSASGHSLGVMSKPEDGKSVNSWDDKSVYSNVEEGGGGVEFSNANAERNVLKSPPRAPGMAFDFGFDDFNSEDVNDYDYDNDDDLVAAANAEALASDDEGFYGQEFAFYGRPRANSNEFNPTIGGYFGEEGDDGLNRNKSLREPNLTPITERSEFSTRNSVIGLGLGMGGQALHGPPSAGLYGAHSPALARMSVTPLMENEVSFDELRKLRGQAFGGGGGKSLQSNSARSSAQSLEGLLIPGQSARPGMSNSQSYTGAAAGTHFNFASGTDSSGSSNPSSAPVLGQAFQDSPPSATSSQGNPFSMDLDATPRKKSQQPVLDPATVKKVPRESMLSQNDGQSSHSRQGSGADSVTYVREPGTPGWVMERRRTSEQGQLQLIGRELVQGGWI